MPWSLNTRMLRMLLAIADQGSASKAAAALNVSPSALSHQIRQAEAMLRVKLFDRINGRLQPTAAATEVIGSARIVVAEMDRAESGLDRRRAGSRSSLRVGGGPYPLHRWLVPLLRDRPDLPDIHLVVAQAASLARAVVEGELDCAIVAGDRRERGIVAVPLFRDHLVAVVPPGHLLAGRAWVDASDLAGEVYISYSRRIEDGLEDDRVFRPARKAPSRFLEAHSVEAIASWVSAGAGFSVLSRWAVAPEARRGRVVAVPLTPGGLLVDWCAVIRAGGPEAALAAMFADRIARDLDGRPPGAEDDPADQER